MKVVSAIVERGIDGEYPYSVFMDCDDLEYGLSGTGRDVQEAKSDFLDAYAEIKELYESQGRAFTQVEFKFQYDLPSFLRYYEYAFTLAGLERITGVNQHQLSHYINGTSKPRTKTVERIQESIRNFGRDISDINLVCRK